MERNRKRRIFLVEDHPIVRLGFLKLIEQDADLEVCGESETASDALSRIRELRPDLALLDIALDRSSGFELIKALHAESPDLPVLVVSMHDESLYAGRTLRAGARGYVMKREAPQSLLGAIRRVLSGKVYLSESAASHMVQTMSAGSSRPGSGSIESLSDRELEVFHFISEGMSVRDIAGALHLSVKTIETHRARIIDKLRLTSSSELVRFAALAGLTGPHECSRPHRGKPDMGSSSL